MLKTNKAYKFRLFPTKTQETKLENTLSLCRELYNAALQERRDAYRMVGKSLSYYDQANQLPPIKAARSDIATVHSQVLQDVLRRVDKAFKAFLDRVKNKPGLKAGYPRFQGRNRYDSFTYPQSGWSLNNNRLTLSKLGTFKMKLHRKVQGKVKNLIIKREGLHWYVVFNVEYEFEQPMHFGPVVGLDVGLEHLVNQSDGVQIENPRFFRKSQKHLTKVQRKWAKLKHLPPSNPTKRKAHKAIIRVHSRVRNQRRDFLQKISTRLTRTYSLIAVEDLKIKNLLARPKPKQDEASGDYLPNGATIKAGLNKSIVDASWATLISMLRCKVEWTGAKLVEVDPKKTSQTCPDCGAVRNKELSVRWHSCECGCSVHRDVAAAKVILARGLASVRNQSVDDPGFSFGV